MERCTYAWRGGSTDCCFDIDAGSLKSTRELARLGLERYPGAFGALRVPWTLGQRVSVILASRSPRQASFEGDGIVLNEGKMRR